MMVPQADDTPVTILSRGIQIKGKLHVNGNVRVEGDMEGEISASAQIVVDDGAVVRAHLTAESVLHHRANGRFEIVDGGETVASFDVRELRISLSWKACE